MSALSRTHELRGTLRITGGVYCTYDAFSQTDLRVAMLLPGGVSCKAQTPAGATPNVDPAWWSGAVVSGTARWLMVDAPAAAKADPTVRVFAPLFESPRHGDCPALSCPLPSRLLRLFRTCPRAPAESRVLHASLVALAESGALAARQHRLAAPWDDARGSCAAEMESLSSALAHLLLRSRSRDAGARLLAQLAPLWPSAALPLSRALRDGALDTSDTPEHGGRGGGDASAADDAWLQVEDRDLGYHLLEEALTACEDPGSCLGRPGGAQRGEERAKWTAHAPVGTRGLCTPACFRLFPFLRRVGAPAGVREVSAPPLGRLPRGPGGRGPACHSPGAAGGHGRGEARGRGRPGRGRVLRRGAGAAGARL